MLCRGPDDAGVWISDDGRVALGHRRLAILDPSSRSAQPMRSDSGRYVISYNGEIYNFRELRRRLEALGEHFRSDGDTEVLLALYARKGADMVHELRGMFALAIWDEARRGLLLARDHFGIKPLYYADDGRSIMVASEVKALLAAGGIDTGVEPAGHAGFFLWGAVPEPFTLYRGIRALPAGSTMWIDSGGADRPRVYASVGRLLAEGERDARELPAARADAELRTALLESVQRHLVADVDVGLFLSAGRDSTTLAALASELRGQLRTVTLGFAEYRGTHHDETPLAEMAARHYGTDHRTLWITRDEFHRERDRLLDRMDQPTTDGVNSYFVARAAAETGLKVALSGLGGDELFGGYPEFQELPRLVGALGRVPGARAVGRAMRALVAPLIATMTSPKYASVAEYGTTIADAYLLRRALFMPWELANLLGDELAEAGWSALAARDTLADTASVPRDTFHKVSALVTAHYMRNQLLRDTDWASMSHALEVRTPLVDWALWRRAAAIYTAGAPLGKAALARAARPALPPEIAQRRKTGFSIPTREWMHDEGVPQHGATDRGLRGWARYVYARMT